MGMTNEENNSNIFLNFFFLNSTHSYSKGSYYKDGDWNKYFYDNCGFPSSKNLSWVKEKITNF